MGALSHAEEVLRDLSLTLLCYGRGGWGWERGLLGRTDEEDCRHFQPRLSHLGEACQGLKWSALGYPRAEA